MLENLYNTIINMNSIVLLTFIFGYVAAGTVSQSQKIVGGQPVNINNFPYQVSLRYNGYHICGGSIISASWVLTASHCVHNRPAAYISFRAGSNLTSTGGFIANTLSIIKHPYYDPVTYNYDFALAKVSPAFPIGQAGINFVQVAMIEPKPGTITSVSGWGTTSAGGSVSAVLLATDVVIVSTTSCNTSYTGEIFSQMICAAATGKDSCQGDSGGPLISKATKQLVGVVSWGTGCADPLYPGVYSNIPTARMWIRKIAGV